MSTNGVNSAEDSDMVDCDGEKVVTMMDVLQEQQEFEEDANAVLGASDEKNCTYTKGYVKRQAIYACITCCPDAKDDPIKRAGVCLACSLNCHENHELVELYTKRNFRCDCGNPKFNSNPCQFIQSKPDLNDDNYYNQNFSGLYCVCHRPYPDPEFTDEDEMIQCIICEDWLHASHLEATIPTNEQYSEMVCKGCMEKNVFLHDYSDIAINNELGEIDVINISSAVSLNDTNECNGYKDQSFNNVATIPSETNDEKLNEMDVDVPEKNVPENTSNNVGSIDVNTINEELPIVDSNVDEQSKTNGVEDKSIVSEEFVNKLPDKSEEQSQELNLPIVNDALEDSVSNPEADGDKQNSSKDAEDKTINKENTSEEQLISTDTTETLYQTGENINELKENVLAASQKDSKNITMSEPSEDTVTKNVDPDDISNVSSTVDDKTKNLDIGNAQKPKESKVGKGIDETIEHSTINNVVSETEPQVDGKNDTNMENSTENTENQLNNDPQNKGEMNNCENKDTVNESNQVGKSEINIEGMSTKESEVDTSIANDKEVGSSETNGKEVVEENTVTSDKEIDSSETNGKEFVEENTVTNDKEIDSSETNEKVVVNTVTSDKVVNSTDMDVVEVNTVTTDKAPDRSEANEKEVMEENGMIETSSEISGVETSTQENKRKLSAEQSDTEEVTTKKVKLEERKSCSRPKGVKKRFKGATFWPSNFRQKLCTCSECLSMYKDLSVLFLIDPEDTVTAYETLGKENTVVSQYEKGLEALSSLDRIQQINALTEYNKMRDKLLDFLKSFKDRKEVVKEEDIKAFFAGMKPKREPDGVYFCR